jgi:[ribosomal protein S5]-alanine N-acetyltransferase
MAREGDGVPAIAARRLELLSMSPEFLVDLLANRQEAAARLLGAAIPDDWPDGHDRRFLGLRLEQMRREPASREWLVRAIVLREGRTMIGHVGFHGPPGTNGPRVGGAVEIGYSIFPDHRGHGYATEAATALLDWARSERGIGEFVASVSPLNDASLAIVRKLGFVQTGDQWDEEDGLELVFRLGSS